MTSIEFYELIQLPKGVVEQLNEYEKRRKEDISGEIKEKLFRRETWDEGVKELQVYLGEDEYGMNVLWEQLYLAYTYSYEEYVKRGINMKIFADTFGFITRFVSETKDEQGKYKYSWAWWFQRQVTLEEFRIGSLEYEFVENNGHREVEVHIPSDADMSFEGLAKSVKDFLEFEQEYMPDWVGVSLTTMTWLIMPELEELLPGGSNILTFKSLFDIEYVDYNQNWYMGWIFPGYTEVNEDLPERTTLHKKLKEHLLSGKKFGVAKGHLVLDRIKK